MPLTHGTAIHLGGRAFLLDAAAPGMPQELRLLALHLDNLAEARRRQAMFAGRDRSGPPPAWAFVAPAGTQAILASRELRADELLASLWRCPRAWNFSDTGRPRRNRLLDRLEMRACVWGERLKIDAHLGQGVWLRDVERGRLELPRALSETVAAALAGREIRAVVDHPAVVGGTIRKVRSGAGRAVIDFVMGRCLLAPPPDDCFGWPRTARDDGSGATPPWHSEGSLRRALLTELDTAGLGIRPSCRPAGHRAVAA